MTGTHIEIPAAASGPTIHGYERPNYLDKEKGHNRGRLLKRAGKDGPKPSEWESIWQHVPSIVGYFDYS